MNIFWDGVLCEFLVSYGFLLARRPQMCGYAAPPPKNVCTIKQLIQQDVDRKIGTIFFKLTTCSLLNSLDTVAK